MRGIWWKLYAHEKTSWHGYIFKLETILVSPNGTSRKTNAVLYYFLYYLDGGAVIKKRCLHIQTDRFTFEKFPPPPPLLHLLVTIRIFFLVQSATHLACQVQQERTQVVYSNKVGRSRLAQRHSRNGPRTYEHWFDVYIGILYWSRHSHTHTYKQTRNWTNHKCIIID